MSLLTLPGMDARQGNLPGLDDLAPLWPPVGIREAIQVVADFFCPGQLSLVVDQPPLSEAEPPPRQLPLLPDPPLWELQPAEPAPKRPRGPRKRSKNELSKGQMSLF